MIGFAWNDRPWSGMTALATASDSADTALKWALALARRAWDRRGDFGLEMETADIQPGIARAIAADDGPVYLSDSGDNTTAGAPGDLTIVLQAALDAPGIADALVLGILAPGTVRRAQEAGVGASIEVELGAEHISLVAPKRRAAAIVEAFDDALRLEGFQPYGLSQGGWARLRFGAVVATFHEFAGWGDHAGAYDGHGRRPDLAQDLCREAGLLASAAGGHRQTAYPASEPGIDRSRYS